MTVEQKLQKFFEDKFHWPFVITRHWNEEYADKWFIVTWTDGPKWDDVDYVAQSMARQVKTIELNFVCNRKYSEGHSHAENQDQDLRR